MGGAPVVIALVGLVFPIALILAALVFDAVILAWALYRLLHNHMGRPFALAAHALRWHSRGTAHGRA